MRFFLAIRSDVERRGILIRYLKLQAVSITRMRAFLVAELEVALGFTTAAAFIATITVRPASTHSLFMHILICSLFAIVISKTPFIEMLIILLHSFIFFHLLEILGVVIIIILLLALVLLFIFLVVLFFLFLRLGVDAPCLVVLLLLDPSSAELAVPLLYFIYLLLAFAP